MREKRENQKLNTRRKPAQTRAIPENRGAKRYLHQSKPLASRLLRLARALTAVPSHSQLAGISHAECEALLEFYVGDEQRQEDVRSLYPAVWKHIRTCTRCRESYILMTQTALEYTLSDWQSQFSSGDIPNLPFLSPTIEAAAWSKQVRSRVGGASLGFGFILQPSHVQQLIVSQPALSMRGQPGQDKKALLLADTINLGNRDVMVNMWMVLSENSREGRLEISLVASAPLPEPLRATLRWNEHQYSDMVRQGFCAFDHLSISGLKNVRDFRVEFETGESQATVEGQHGNSRPPV